MREKYDIEIVKEGKMIKVEMLLDDMDIISLDGMFRAMIDMGMLTTNTALKIERIDD